MEKKIFISWSGEKAKKYADILINLFVLAFPDQRGSFFYSKQIEDGQEWLTQIFENLRKAQYGLIILTRESFERPWVNFEAGGIFTNKTPDEIKRIIPIYVDVTMDTLSKSPLRFFQGNKIYTYENIYNLITTTGDTLGWHFDRRFLENNKGQEIFNNFINTIAPLHPVWKWLYQSNTRILQDKGCIAEMEGSEFLKLRKIIIKTSKPSTYKDASEEEKRGRIILSGQSLSEAFGESSGGDNYICEELLEVIKSGAIKHIDIFLTDPYLFNNVESVNYSESPMSRSILTTLDTLRRIIFPVCKTQKCYISIYYIPLLEIDHAIITDEFMAFRSTKLWTQSKEYKGSYKIYTKSAYFDSEYKAHYEYLEMLRNTCTKIDLDIDSKDSDEDGEVVKKQKEFRRSIKQLNTEYVSINKVYHSQLLESVADSWMGVETIHNSFIPSKDIKTVDDLFDAKNLLDDKTQHCLLPFIKQTRSIFEKLISEKYDSSHVIDSSGIMIPRSGVEIFPSLDLGIPNNIQRIAGGFATGMLIIWKCGTPIVPVDATVNVCSSSVYKLNAFNETLSEIEFIKKVEDIIREGNKKGYAFSFDNGNHFFAITKDNTKKNDYYLVLHSSAKEYKDSFIGLYPTENNWFKDKIRIYTDKAEHSRYIRYLKDNDAKDFISFAHRLEGYNEEIHSWYAKQWGGVENTSRSTFHHYYMPTDSSIAIGTYVEKPGTVVPIFSNVGFPIYLFQIGYDNWKVKINGALHCVIPHGWGQEIVSNSPKITISLEDDSEVIIDGKNYLIDSSSRIENSQKQIRQFNNGEDFLKHGNKYVKGIIKKTLTPVYLYCSKLKGKVEFNK